MGRTFFTGILACTAFLAAGCESAEEAKPDTVALGQHKRYVAVLNEWTQVLEKITDGPSFQAARSDIEDVGKRMRAIRIENKGTKNSSIDLTESKYPKKYEREATELRIAWEGVYREKKRISDMPGGDQVILQLAVYEEFDSSRR